MENQIISKDEIEVYLYVNSVFYDEEKTKEIYDLLMKEYDTDMDGLDKLYFEVFYKKISSLSRESFIDFLFDIKNILKKYFVNDEKKFSSSYFRTMLGLVNILEESKYGNLSNFFKKDKKIKKLLVKELLSIFDAINDKSKIGSLIDELEGVKDRENFYEYWENFKVK